MKVVSVLTTESNGGGEFAAVDLLDALAERGHDAVLVTNRPELKGSTRIATRVVDLGPKLSRATHRRIRSRFLGLSRRFNAALDAERPYDVLIVHYKKEQLLTLALGSRASRPLIVWAEWGPVPFELQRGFPNLLYRRAAARADVILAISEGTRRSLTAAGVPDDKVVVLPNAVRTDAMRFSEEGRAAIRARLGIPQDVFVVGCISRFHPKKRNDVVIDAVSRLDGETHLVLAGDGDAERSLRALATPLGKRVHFMSMPTTELADVYSAFDVSVFCPSPTEGAPRAVILAMLTERPVVSTGPQGVAEFLSEVGAIIDPENDPDALATALARYRDDPGLRERDGARGRDLVEETHASGNVAARLERLLLEGLARRGDEGHADAADATGSSAP